MISITSVAVSFLWNGAQIYIFKSPRFFTISTENNMSSGQFIHFALIFNAKRKLFKLKIILAKSNNRDDPNIF